MELDGGKIAGFTFSGSDAIDRVQSLDQSEEHKTTKEYKAMDQTQRISRVMDDEITLHGEKIILPGDTI